MTRVRVIFRHWASSPRVLRQVTSWVYIAVLKFDAHGTERRLGTPDQVLSVRHEGRPSCWNGQMKGENALWTTDRKRSRGAFGLLAVSSPSAVPALLPRVLLPTASLYPSSVLPLYCRLSKGRDGGIWILRRGAFELEVIVALVAMCQLQRCPVDLPREEPIPSIACCHRARRMCKIVV